MIKYAKYCLECGALMDARWPKCKQCGSEHGQKKVQPIEVKHINITTMIKVKKICNCEYCGYKHEESFYINSKDNFVNVNSNNLCPQCCATLKITTKEEIVNSTETKEFDLPKNKPVKTEEQIRKAKKTKYKNMLGWGIGLLVTFGLSFIYIITQSSGQSSCIGAIPPMVVGLILILIANQKRKALKKEKPQED